MLYTQGECVSCVPFTRQWARDGKVEAFHGHTVSIVDRAQASLPINVEIGPIPLRIGKLYELPINVRVFKRRDGSVAHQYQCPKDHQPTEIIDMNNNVPSK